MINQPFKTKLFLLVIIFASAGVKLNAQPPLDSISKRLKLECKRYSREGKYDAAFHTAQKLKIHATKLRDTALLLDSYNRLGYYANKNGNPVHALNQYNYGMDLNTSLKMEVHKLPLLFNKCGILNKVGDYREAQKDAILGITLAKKFNRRSHIRNFYNEFAIASANNQEFIAAEEAYQNVLNYSINDLEKASVLNNIGVNYKHQKKYAQAIKVYDSILTHLKFTSHKLEAKIESNLGFALLQLGDKDRSLSLLKSALNTRIGEENYNEIFASYIHLTAYYLESDKTQAIYYARKAYEIAYNKIKSPDSQEEALLNIIRLNAASDQEAKRYAFLADSIQRAERKTTNEYTATKFQIKEREIEIAKKETQNSYYLLGIITIAICLLSLFIYARQRKNILSRNHEIATLEARENERNNISGKVHDYVVDKIREAMLFADHYEAKHPNIGFASIADKVENAYQELRKVSQDYMHLDFDKIVFPKRVQGLLEEREKLYSIAMDAEGLGEIGWAKVSITSKTELYRSLQELLVNSSKHSQATQILVLFDEEEKQINMEVKDNGVGCAFSENMESAGLTDLKRRIANLDGSTYLFSKPKHGFHVKIGIPLK